MSRFLEDYYGTKEMRAVFTDEHRLQCMLDVEVAIAHATADCGLIPAEAADLIAGSAKVSEMDLDRVQADVVRTGGHPIMGLLYELERIVPKGAAEYVHWGATTQDIVDTAMVLQLKSASDLIYRDLLRLERTLVSLAEEHKDTVMAGRTHGQHAVPTTFGFKVAVWAREAHRHVVRLEQIAPRLFLGSLSGGVGTLASLGAERDKVLARVMEILDLRVSDIAWHTARDHIAEFASICGMICATNSKMCREIANLMRTEIDEVEEPFHPGKIGSSTMPQKRNPMMCENVMAVEKLCRRLVSAAAEAMMQEHERDLACWMTEWTVIPEVCDLTSRSLANTNFVMQNLVVKPERMREALWTKGGMIFAESAMMVMAPKLGRQRAHEIVYEACMKAATTGKSLEDALREEPTFRANMSEDELRSIFECHRYVSSASETVQRVVDGARSGWARFQQDPDKVGALATAGRGPTNS